MLIVASAMSLGEGAREPKKQPGLRLSSDSFYPPWTLLAAIITWLSYLWDSSSNKHRKVVWEKEKKTKQKTTQQKTHKTIGRFAFLHSYMLLF